MNNNPSVVLVHGAWGDGSCWGKVITILKEAGYRVSATQQHLNSLEEDAEITRRVVEMQEGPVILVGHSYGGAVITEAAGKTGNVAGLVYIAAFAPDEGESLGELSKQFGAPQGNSAIRPDKYGSLWLDKEMFAAAFCQDADKSESDIMAAVQKPIAVKCFTDKVSRPAWKYIPTWYQVSENDQMIAPALEKFMAERMEPKDIIYLPSGHASMVAYPKEIARLIMDACKYVDDHQKTETGK